MELGPLMFIASKACERFAFYTFTSHPLFNESNVFIYGPPQNERSLVSAGFALILLSVLLTSWLSDAQMGRITTTALSFFSSCLGFMFMTVDIVGLFSPG